MGQVKFFKGCLPQILLGSFLNTLSHIQLERFEHFAAHDHNCFLNDFRIILIDKTDGSDPRTVAGDGF